MKHVVVVGGGVAAKGFLSSAMSFYEDTKFTFIRNVEKGPVPCGIPYAFGTLKSPYDNVSPDTGLTKAGAELIIDEITSINTEDKTVTLHGEENISYDRLVLAMGAEPFVPPFPGKDLENIEIVKKDVDFVNELKTKVENAKNIVVVGGGFIGVELADEIKKMGNKNITIVELSRNCLSAAFDAEYCEEAESLLIENGVTVLTGKGVTEFKGDTKVNSVVLNTGETLEADLVFLSIGVKPVVNLAMDAGLNASPRGGITVDNFMYTSDPNVLAIGDCASKVDLITGKPSGIKLASVAAREGRIAAANLFARNLPVNPVGVTSLFSTCIDGVYLAATGMTQEQLDRENFNYEVVEISTIDRHPVALPDAKEIKGKFIFAKHTGVLLGVQLRGNVQVAEMINFLGYALQNKATAFDLYTINYSSHPLGTSAPTKYITHLAAREMVRKLQK